MSEANLTRRVSPESVSALLTVENGNWGATSLRSIHAVLASAAGVLADAFGRVPDAPIRVAPWSRDPQVFDDQRPYQIRLSARDRYWSQYVYQFSHEFCHVMTNFDRHKGHKHRTYARRLCGTIAVALLDSFQADATLWRDCGHLNHWDPNADPAFKDYLDSWGSCPRERGTAPRAFALVRKLLQIQ